MPMTLFSFFLLYPDSKNASIYLLKYVFKRFALKVNISKTETQLANRIKSIDPVISSPLIQLDSVDIKNTELFKYLGAQISSTEAGIGWTEINYRIQNAKCQFFQKKETCSSTTI